MAKVIQIDAARNAKPASPSPATTAVAEFYRPTQSGEVRQVQRSRNREVVSISRRKRGTRKDPQQMHIEAMIQWVRKYRASLAS